MHRLVYLVLDIGMVLSAIVVGLRYRQQWLSGWRPTLQTVGIVAVLFVAWDMAAVHAGHWRFNALYTLGLRIGGLPIEEWLFFVAVPLIAMSMWELIRPQETKRWRVFGPVQAAIALGCAVFGVIQIGRGYSMAASSAALCSAGWWAACPYGVRRWLIFEGLLFGCFFCVNTILTALPVVEYGSAAYSGLRIGSIPVEDFLYNYALVGATILTYAMLKNRPYYTQQRGRECKNPESKKKVF